MSNVELIEYLRERNIELLQENIELKKRIKSFKVQAETSNSIAQTQMGTMMGLGNSVFGDLI